jgi:hypothetical protein
VKRALCLAILFTSALWADEAADRAAVETTISALNRPQINPEIFTADFPNAAELQRALGQKVTITPIQIPVPAEGTKITTPAGTLVISREPMGEATFYPVAPNFSGTFIVPPHFKTRSVTFISPDTAVVVAEYQNFSMPPTPALFVLRKVGEDWRIASFRVLPEAQTKPVL